MICRHCGKPIELKKGIWKELLPPEDICKLKGWQYVEDDPFNNVCFAGLLNGNDSSGHEPTKESKIEQLLRDVDEV